MRRYELGQLTDDGAAVRAAVRPPQKSASDEVIGLARVEQDKDPKLSSTDAMERVFKLNPDLYARYTTETAVKV